MSDNSASYPASQGGYVAPNEFSIYENSRYAQDAVSTVDRYVWFYEKVKIGGDLDYKCAYKNDGMGFQRRLFLE